VLLQIGGFTVLTSSVFSTGRESGAAALIARSYLRVYDRPMVRKCASLVLGLALIVAAGFAMAHAHPLKAPGGSTGFSTPCEPASPAFQAGESTVVAPVDSAFPAEHPGAPTGAVRGSRVEAVSRSVPALTTNAYPPLWHRPPPASS
jgi:hypothetical protein